MDANGIIALLRQKRDAWHECVLMAGPGTTDEGTLERARRAADFVTEYDELLALIASGN